MITKEESEKKISKLRESIEGIGRADYPFSHKNYELATTIPCTDFTKWIIERYLEKDFWAIKLLKWEIIRGAGFFGFGKAEDPNLPLEEKSDFQGLCLDINYLLSYNLKKFFDTDEFFIAEFFSLLLLTRVKPITTVQSYIYSPDDYRSNLEFNRYVDAISCAPIKPKLDVIRNYILQSEEAKQKYFNERRINYEKNSFNNLELDYKLVESNNLFNTLKSISVSHRLHFWDLINSSYIEDNIRLNRRENLECWYRTYEYGYNPDESRKSLLENNLLMPISNIKMALNKLKKDDIITISEKFNLECKKKETKTSLIDKILSMSGRENELNEILTEKRLFMFNPSIEDDLLRLVDYKKQYGKVLEVLFLAEFGKPYRPVTTLKSETGNYIIYNDDKSKHPLIL